MISKTATIRKIDFDVETREITIKVDARGSDFVEEVRPGSHGFPMLVNSGPLIEGVELVLKYAHIAVEKFKNNKDFSKLIQQNEALRQMILDIAQFEDGRPVTIKGKKYQRGVNETAFYSKLLKRLSKS